MPTPTSRLLQRVPLAWPTLAVFFVAAASWIGSTTAALMGALPWAAAVPLNVMASFLIFTPMHEGVHRALGRVRGLDPVIGVLGGLPLLIPFHPFRYIHLEHHRHTNDPVLDPDVWSGVARRRWHLPLRWMTQDLYYYVRYLRVWSRRPASERLGTVLELSVMVGIVALAIVSGHGIAALVLWIVPARIAIFLLAGLFDYLPHHPHRVPARMDRCAATRVLDHRWFGVLFQNQHLHVIHHLYPAVPFYRYPKVWAEMGPMLEARGVRVERLFTNTTERRASYG